MILKSIYYGKRFASKTSDKILFKDFQLIFKLLENIFNPWHTDSKKAYGKCETQCRSILFCGKYSKYYYNFIQHALPPSNTWYVQLYVMIANATTDSPLNILAFAFYIQIHQGFIKTISPLNILVFAFYIQIRQGFQLLNIMWILTAGRKNV